MTIGNVQNIVKGDIWKLYRDRTNETINLINQVLKQTVEDSLAPSATNDSSEGYDVGSFWIHDDTSNSKKDLYICLVNSVAGAVWHRINSTDISTDRTDLSVYSKTEIDDQNTLKDNQLNQSLIDLFRIELISEPLLSSTGSWVESGVSISDGVLLDSDNDSITHSLDVSNYKGETLYLTYDIINTYISGSGGSLDIVVDNGIYSDNITITSGKTTNSDSVFGFLIPIDLIPDTVNISFTLNSPSGSASCQINQASVYRIGTGLNIEDLNREFYSKGKIDSIIDKIIDVEFISDPFENSNTLLSTINQFVEHNIDITGYKGEKLYISYSGDISASNSSVDLEVSIPGTSFLVNHIVSSGNTLNLNEKLIEFDVPENPTNNILTIRFELVAGGTTNTYLHDTCQVTSNGKTYNKNQITSLNKHEKLTLYIDSSETIGHSYTTMDDLLDFAKDNIEVNGTLHVIIKNIGYTQMLNEHNLSLLSNLIIEGESTTPWPTDPIPNDGIDLGDGSGATDFRFILKDCRIDIKNISFVRLGGDNNNTGILTLFDLDNCSLNIEGSVCFEETKLISAINSSLIIKNCSLKGYDLFSTGSEGTISIDHSYLNIIDSDIILHCSHSGSSTIDYICIGSKNGSFTIVENTDFTIDRDSLTPNFIGFKTSNNSNVVSINNTFSGDFDVNYNPNANTYGNYQSRNITVI